MEFNPTPPTFNLQYTGTPINLGETYAKGMQAGQQVGQDIGKGISNVADVMVRNQNATDLLNAMQQSNMLSPDQYKAVAGKSLGAKETMLGMYASQWIADQANQRALSLARGQAGVDVAKAHAQLLDVYNQAKAGNPAAVDVKKMFWNPNQANVANVNQANVNQPPNQPPIAGPGGGPWLPGTKYGYQTVNGKQVYGHLLPSGAFVAEPGQ